MAEQLKNIYTLSYIENLSAKIKDNYVSFDTQNFIKAVFDNTWQDLELKQRMRHIALKLHDYLPISYEKQLEVLKESSKYFFSYDAMFFQDFVEVYGLDDFKNSMDALEVFTIDSSSEFAIRQFILRDEDKTMKQMKEWLKSPNEHIRRLATEGCRPRLPWAVALPNFKKNPKKVLEIIELLKNDESLYVRKSISNNLNDIAKDNPSLVINFIKENIGFSKDCDLLLKHAARTLLKKGDVQTLEIFGYKKIDNLVLNDFTLDNKVCIGEYLNFSFLLENKAKLGNIRLEYEIDFQMANNKRSKKVYMISQSDIKSNKKSVSKRHSFKIISTRTYYLGKHFITIIVNGIKIETKEFLLTKA